jgi:hypothetical protein
MVHVTVSAKSKSSTLVYRKSLPAFDHLVAYLCKLDVFFYNRHCNQPAYRRLNIYLLFISARTMVLDTSTLAMAALSHLSCLPLQVDTPPFVLIHSMAHWAATPAIVSSSPFDMLFAFQTLHTWKLIAYGPEVVHWHVQSDEKPQISPLNSYRGVTANSVYCGIECTAPRLSTTDESLRTFLNQLASGGASNAGDNQAEYLAKEIGRTLYGFMMTNADDMEMDQPLSTLGLDRLVGIELRNWCRTQIGLDVSILEIMQSTLRDMGRKALHSLIIKYI